MDLSTFEAVVQSVLHNLPEWVTNEMENVAIVVEHRATRDQDPDQAGLLGLYEGIPLSERGFDYFGVSPDRITIFYEPHIGLGLSDPDLRSEIRTTVLHEVAHHLGIDDDRLDELGWS
ncbi:MAG: metallopeptidase family protein [Actinomycetota bacterium]